MDRVARLQPDVILMDVLMPGLEASELARLAARCMSASPALVVHTRLLKPMVRRVVNARAVYGLIPKSGIDVDFVRGFREVTDRLVSEMPTQVFVPRVSVGGMSGTYALKPTGASALVTTGG
jgi:DNA-binding NarL/FixJ family response regulator